MSIDIVNKLPELRKDSGKWLDKRILSRLRSGSASRLIRPVMVANADWAVEPLDGPALLVDEGRRRAVRRVKNTISRKRKTHR